jgi:hypothetical protein
MYAGVHKSLLPVRPGDEILYGGVYYFWVVNKEVLSHHLSGGQKFEVARRILEFWTPEYTHIDTVVF